MSSPVVRHLRPTDIRCRTAGCDAEPGAYCLGAGSDFVSYSIEGGHAWIHRPRMDEYNSLVDSGWEWQEVDPTDRGSSR